MDTISFEPPVGIYFGKPGQTRVVGSLGEAGECLMSDSWPDHSGVAFKKALITLIAVAEGCASANKGRLPSPMRQRKQESWSSATR